VREGGTAARFLEIGWRTMVIWGIGVAAVGIAASLVNHLLSPQALLYTPADEQFTGLTWTEIQGMGSALGLWLALFYDTTVAMMVFYGSLTAFVAMTAFRRGERWAWLSLLASFFVSSGYLIGSSSAFLGRGMLGISGISIGVPGLLLVIGFLFVGLILPGLDIRKLPAARSEPPAGRPKSWGFSWIALAIILGGINIVAAIFVPLTDHLSIPGAPPTYMMSDAAFSGVSWAQIVASSPGLSLWIVLQMDNMCARMMGAGILATAVTIKGFRSTERWAFNGLLVATAVSWGGLLVISIPSYLAGFTDASTISLGALWDVGSGLFLTVIILLNVIALALAYPYFRDAAQGPASLSKTTP
jgi:hypothetical protein